MFVLGYAKFGQLSFNLNSHQVRSQGKESAEKIFSLLLNNTEHEGSLTVYNRFNGTSR